MLPPVDQLRHCSFLHKLCTLTSNLCIFIPTFPSPETSSQPQAASQIAIYQEMVYMKSPWWTKNGRRYHNSKIDHCSPSPHTVMYNFHHNNEQVIVFTHWCIYLPHETELHERRDFCLFIVFLLDANGVCKVFCKCWVNCSCKRRSSIFWTLVHLFVIHKAWYGFVEQIIERIWPQESGVWKKFLSRLFCSHTNTDGERDGTVAALGTNKAIFMGCRKKAFRILPFPILHSCFSILTCSAFKLQNNLRFSTFILYNSDTDSVIKKLLDNPKPHASLLPGRGMTRNGRYAC